VHVDYAAATGDIAPGIASLHNAAPASDFPDCRWQVVSDWTAESPVVRSGDTNGDGLGGFFTSPVRFQEGQGNRLFDCNGMFWWSST
jgi:hypothetical protein